MLDVDPSGARWTVAPDRGHYESYFLEAVPAGGGRGLWLRCTAGRLPGGPTRGAVWASFIDPAQGGVVAVRRDDLLLDAGAGVWIRCGDSAFSPTVTRGCVEADGIDVSWDLAFASAEPPLFHLPRAWMYRARLPRTKLVSPLPAATVDGQLTVNGRSVDVAGWRGVVGHNWGELHAQRWVWMQGVVGAGPHAGSWLDVVAARIRVAGVLVPWTAFGAICLDGRRIALGGLGRRLAVSASRTTCELAMSGHGVKVSATVSAAAGALVSWDYFDPSGTRHPVSNCPVSDLWLRVERRGQKPLELRLPGSAVYEYGQTG